jgi:hypothetical protein
MRKKEYPPFPEQEVPKHRKKSERKRYKVNYELKEGFKPLNKFHFDFQDKFPTERSAMDSITAWAQRRGFHGSMNPPDRYRAKLSGPDGIRYFEAEGADVREVNY